MLEITYNKKDFLIKNKFSSFRCNLLRSAKAYVNQFLALTNAMFSSIV
jgi:hypothetical protein